MTLIFNMPLEFVKLHVRAKFHQAKCSGSWAIVLTQPQSWKQYCRIKGVTKLIRSDRS